MTVKQVVIMGAGPAGLTAAYELLKRSGNKFNVIVLEKNNTVGGMARSIDCNGNIIDPGGHRFYSDHSRVTDWWEEILPLTGRPAIDYKILQKKPIGVSGGPDPEVNDDVMLLRRLIASFYIDGRYYDFPFERNGRTRQNMGIIKYANAVISQKIAGRSTNHGQSMEDYYVNQMGGYLYENFFRPYAEKKAGKHPAEIFDFPHGQKACVFDGYNDPNGEYSDTRYRYPKFGAGHLWQKVAQKITQMGGHIFCNHTVLSADHTSDTLTSVRCVHNGTERVIKADYFISTVPIADLMAGFNPAPPAELLATSQKLVYRNMQVIGLHMSELEIKKPFAPSLGELIPDTCIYVGDSNLKLAKIQIYNNRSPYMVKDIYNSVWLGLEYYCREEDMYWSLSDDEMLDLAFSELKQMGIASRDKLLDFCRIKNEKAFSVYPNQDISIEPLHAYLDSFKNLYCIGGNGQHRFYNMSSAMQTAFEAADSILFNKNNKVGVWNINNNH